MVLLERSGADAESEECFWVSARSICKRHCCCLVEGFAFMMPLYKRTLESLEVQEAEILAFAVIKDISMTLKLANDIGIQHRDVTPSNISVSDKDQGILGDWSIAIEGNTPVTDGSMTRFYASNGYLEACHYFKPYQFRLADDLESLFYC